MYKIVNWLLLGAGLAVIAGALFWAVSMDRSVSGGVDLGLEGYYAAAVAIGGALIYWSTKNFGKEKK